MNLKYRILWIEDQEDWLDGLDVHLESLKKYIEDQGFDVEIEFRVTADEIARDVDGSAYELIVIDNNLTEDGSVKGDGVINSIREHDHVTEVIFYSGDPTNTLRISAAEKGLEGVYFAGKESDALFGKLRKVFDITVRKIVDENNMRGIVMAGVADLDHQLADILRAIHNQLDADKQSNHCKKLFGKMLPVAKAVKVLVADEAHASISALQAAIDVLKDLPPKDFECLIAHRGFDSHKRVEAISSLCGDHQHLSEYKKKIDEMKDLLQWRNALAHQQPQKQDGIHLFDISGKLEPFDENRRRELRKTLREHQLHLQQVGAKAKEQ